ncbi:hypothetical protein MJH12_10725, partial [bacterium]|nr:hypothetical protein [bacterium]
AELKDLYKQIKRVKKELELQKITKVRDLDTVQGRIQVLYDDIDTHLEDPHSSYNDDYILNRKKRISRLMKKRRVLKTDLKHLNYSKVQRKQKQLEFLLDRKKEIHENSKSLQFKFTQKRVTAIQKNNARINYLISVSLPKRTIKKIRRSMKIIRKIRDKIAKMERSGSKAESNLSSEEQSIRFEKEYYSQIERREDELMDEIRRDREKIKGFRSRSRVDQKMKPATALNSTSGLNGSSTLSNSESDVSSEKNEYVYVYKTNQSPSAAKGINPNNGGAMWVFPVKKGTNILQNMERIGIPSGVTMQMGQNNQPQNAQILQQLEQLRMQNQLLQQQLYRSENMGRQQYYQPPVQNYQQPSQNYGAQVTPSNRNMSNESILPIQQRTEQNVVPVQQRKTTPPPRGGSQSMSQKRTYNNTQLLNGRTRQGAAQVEPRQYRSTVKVREEVPVKSPELNNVTLVPKKKDALSDFTLSDDLLLK